jgi:hypothetical protein
MELGDFPMIQKMLRGIKRRAEKRGLDRLVVYRLAGSTRLTSKSMARTAAEGLDAIEESDGRGPS